MTITRAGPLNWRVPIVDKEGRPTPEFIRYFQQLMDNDTGINSDVTQVVSDVSDIVEVTDGDKGDVVVSGDGTHWVVESAENDFDVTGNVDVGGLLDAPLIESTYIKMLDGVIDFARESDGLVLAEMTGGGTDTSDGIYIFYSEDGVEFRDYIVGATLYGRIGPEGLTSTDGFFSGNVTVADEAYGGSWDGSLEVPTKNAVYDKIESLSGGYRPMVDGSNPPVFIINTEHDLIMVAM